ncbi:hypothetical protein ACFEMC_10540 [Kineococcus sp. DHX-1]|uniref:hypothetical protein n=1 Tax=Kineococcus sp. DHX-1 TaxID=3349638 RepID=UPI0036D291C1
MTTQTRSLHEDGDPLASALSSAVHGLRAPDLGPDLAAIQRRGRRRRWARRAAVATPAALLAGTAVLGMTHIAPTNHDLRVVPAASTGVLDHDQVVQALDRAVAGAIPGKHITAVSALPRDDGQTAAWTASLSDRSTKPHTELLLQVVPGPLSPGEPLTGCDGENVSGCTEVGLADGSRLITGTVGPGTSTPGTGGDQENPQPPSYDLSDEPFATLVTVNGGMVTATATIGVEDGGQTQQLDRLPAGSPFTPESLQAIVADSHLRQGLGL